MATEFNRWPSEFWSSHPVDKAFLIAYHRVSSDLTAFEQLQESDRIREENKAKGKGN